MTEKLARRGVAVPAAFHADPLRSTPVRAIMTGAGEPAEDGVVAIEAGESLQAALQRMVEEGVDQLPVTDHDRLVGVCTRADVMSAQLRPLALEQREQGWLARRSSRNGTPSLPAPSEPIGETAGNGTTGTARDGPEVHNTSSERTS
jgi:hypothetical protein